MAKNKITNDDLADSLDELWSMLADLQAQVQALGQQLGARDRMNLLMVQHVQRLTREKQALMVHLGYKYLERNPAIIRQGDIKQ
jgi:hypothetical protein